MVLTIKDGIWNTECGCRSERPQSDSFGKEKQFRIINTSFSVLYVVRQYVNVQYYSILSSQYSYKENKGGIITPTS